MGRRCGVQSPPIDSGNEPLPLPIGECEHRRICTGPSEVTLMQTSLAEPNASAVPDQELEPILSAVAKGVGAAVARCAAQGGLYPLRQCRRACRSLRPPARLGPASASWQLPQKLGQPRCIRCRQFDAPAAGTMDSHNVARCRSTRTKTYRHQSQR